MKRRVKNIHQAIEAHMPGLSTWQALPNRGLEYLDPFILLNHHGPETFAPNNRGLPFGPHPHRGFETLTFIFKGDLVHQDSTGHTSKMGPGGVQWMTAGKGIIHSEVSSDEFKQNGGEEEVLQLWMNLPAKLKMTDPDYHGLKAEELTRIEEDDGKVEVSLISGEWGSEKGPHDSLTGLTMSYIHFEKGGKLLTAVPEGQTIFCYVVNGVFEIEGQSAQAYQLVEFGKDGAKVEIIAEEKGLLLFGYGEPLNEAKVAQGPFVMNTVGELKQAFLDYQAGKFE